MACEQCFYLQIHLGHIYWYVLSEFTFCCLFQELRGRFRSLSHLPLTCELALCEMDLKPPTVSHATLKQFSDEIQKRRQKRTKKRKDERRREKRAEAKNNCSGKISSLLFNP